MTAEAPWPTTVLRGDAAAALSAAIGFHASTLLLVAVGDEEEAALVTELVRRYRNLQETRAAVRERALRDFAERELIGSRASADTGERHELDDVIRAVGLDPAELRAEAERDEPFEWDQANPRGVGYKAINTRFLATMDGDFCDAEHRDQWGQLHLCIRPPEHTGRHLALERLDRYPVAVWSQ